MSYHRVEPELSELHKILDILSAEEGYKFAGMHTARMALSRAFVMVKLKASDGECFEYTFSAERINRKYHNLQRLAQQNGDPDMAIDYKARALKSAATRKAKAAAKTNDQPPPLQALVNDHSSTGETEVVDAGGGIGVEVPKSEPKTTKRKARTFDENDQETTDPDLGIRPPPKATQKKAKISKPKDPPKAADQPCKCGCGAKVRGNFAIGHDAKLHSAVSKAAKEGKKLPADVRKLAGEYIANRWPEEAKQVL